MLSKEENKSKVERLDATRRHSFYRNALERAPVTVRSAPCALTDVFVPLANQKKINLSPSRRRPVVRQASVDRSTADAFFPLFSP